MCQEMTKAEVETFVNGLGWEDMKWLLTNMFFSEARKAYNGDRESQLYLESQEAKDLCECAGINYALVEAMQKFVARVHEVGRSRVLDELLTHRNGNILRELRKVM